MFEELIKKAEKYGITRSMIGAEMYGKKQYNRIYMIKNPTIKTIEKMEKAIENLKKSLKKHNKINK